MKKKSILLQKFSKTDLFCDKNQAKMLIRMSE